MFRDLFLIRAWQQSKGIFFFILAVIGLQVLFNAKRMNTYPFIVWDMYSRPQATPAPGGLIAVYLDGKRFDLTRLPAWQEETALHSFGLYRQLLQHPDGDPMDELVRHRFRHLPPSLYRYAEKRINNHEAAYAHYPDWLFYYLRKTTQTYFRKLEVKEIYYEYQNGEYQNTGKAFTHLVVQHD